MFGHPVARRVSCAVLADVVASVRAFYLLPALRSRCAACMRTGRSRSAARVMATPTPMSMAGSIGSLSALQSAAAAAARMAHAPARSCFRALTCASSNRSKYSSTSSLNRSAASGAELRSGCSSAASCLKRRLRLASSVAAERRSMLACDTASCCCPSSACRAFCTARPATLACLP
eukprot:6214333-Pleurochrysis_carterae.AAC.2